jgi:RND family efflux transporter MFP subunit
MANKNGLKLLVAAALVAAGYFAVSYYLTPTALVQAAGSEKIAKAVSAQIKVRAEKFLELKTESGGQLMTDLVEGQAVAKGETLVQIDTRQKQIDIDAAKIELESSKAQDLLDQKRESSELRRAQDDLKLKETDRKNGRLSDVAYQQASYQVEQLEFRQESNRILAKARIDRQANGLEAKQLELDKMTVNARFDGTITNLQVAAGGMISPGQTIATLLTNTRVVEARISEENMAQGVAEGQKVRVWFTGVPGDYAGTVKRILPAQDPQTLRYIAHLELNIPAAKLEKTGLSGEGVITIDEKTAKVVVPQRALYNNRLYVVKDGRVQVRIPKPGYVTESIVEILAGLEAGEEVIVDNQDMFRDGQRVRTQAASKETAAN